MQPIFQDVRQAVRLLVRDYRFTIAAVLALALGLAVNNSVFTIVNTAFFRDLPFERPDRLVALGTRDALGREGRVFYQDFLLWRSATGTFQGIAASANTNASFSDENHLPERVRAAYVSANTFLVLGRQPVVGRALLPDDERPGAPAVALIGHALWQSRYAGDPAVLGQTVRINEVPTVVVGVMPADFRYPFAAEIWQPLQLSRGITGAGRDPRSYVSVFGRLAESATTDQARAELEGIASLLASQFPDTNKDLRPTVRPMSNGMPDSRSTFVVFMVAVLFVLLIACANVANLLLARSTSRSRELAIRASLGATRWRIVRQLLIESVLLAAVAGPVGLALSVYGVRLLGTAFDAREAGQPAAQATTPYWVDLSMNAPVFVFLAVMCLIAGIASGLVPALNVSRAGLSEVLKESARGAVGMRTRRWTSAFMIGQLALALVLLTGAGLMIRSFVTMYRTDKVIDTTGLITARLSLATERYGTPEQRRAFVQRLTEQFAANSAFAAVSVTSDVPFMFLTARRQLATTGQTMTAGDKLTSVGYVHIDPSYFEALALPIVRGRSFTSSDNPASQEHAVVSQRLVDRFFPNEDPIGRQIRVSGSLSNEPPRSLTIVGVSRNVPQAVGMDESQTAQAVVYVPVGSSDTPRVVSLIARSPSTVQSAAQQLREQLRSLDANLPLYYVQTIDQVFADQRWGLRIIGTWFVLLAVIALVLATVGIYAMTAHSVVQRTQEIGIRIALGAEPGQVQRLFLRRTAFQVIVGLGIGLAGALAVGRLLQGFITGTSPRDPLTLGLVTLVLASVALIATLIPARRAARRDPLTALRYE